jgi:hypothetical protein
MQLACVIPISRDLRKPSANDRAYAWLDFLTIGVLVPKRDGAVGSEIKELRLAALQEGGPSLRISLNKWVDAFPICQASALGFTSSM